MTNRSISRDFDEYYYDETVSTAIGNCEFYYFNIHKILNIDENINADLE